MAPSEQGGRRAAIPLIVAWVDELPHYTTMSVAAFAYKKPLFSYPLTVCSRSYLLDACNTLQSPSLCLLAISGTVWFALQTSWAEQPTCWIESAGSTAHSMFATIEARHSN